MAVAQVCETSGFQQSALNTLSRIAVRHISHVGKFANSSANLSGRTECNVFDIIEGLEDVGMLEGFSGASQMDRCLAGSGVVGEILDYFQFAEKIRFAYLIPRFPLLKERIPTSSFRKTGESPPGEHIPTWLPAFPDPQTYTCLPAENKLVRSEGMDKTKQAKEYKKVDGSLSNMHKLLDGSGFEVPVSVEWGNASNMKHAVDNNPFLVAALRFGEKEVSPVLPPARFSDDNAVPNHGDAANHISTAEAFSPTINAVKSSGLDSVEARKKVLLDNRPAVQFKFQIGKNPVGKSMNVYSERVAKTNSPSEHNNVNDDKKRKAEEILKESMENLQELAHL